MAAPRIVPTGVLSGRPGDRGPEGEQGARGPAGYNATNAAQDQETIADYIAETAGSNPVSTALAASIEDGVQGGVDALVPPLITAAVAGAVGLTETPADAWRADYFDRLTRIASIEDRPVVTIAQQTTSTITDPGALIRLLRQGDGTNAQPADLVNDTHFLTDGTPELVVVTASTSYVTAPVLPGGTAQAARYMVRHETITDPTNKVIEWQVRPPATSLGYRLWVDGRPVTLTTQSITGLSAGSGHVLKLSFPTARARRVALEFPAGVGINGAFVPNGQTLTRPTYNPVLRQCYLGDSFLGGTGSPPTGAGRGDTWGPLLGLLTGADSRWSFGIGGTGWTTTNPFSERVAAILAAAPHEVYILGSRNDGNVDVSAQAGAVLDSLAAVPRIFVVGPTETAYPSQTASLAATAAAKGRTFIDPAAEKWVNQNNAKYRQADNIHPTYAGQKRIACGIYEGRQKALAI